MLKTNIEIRYDNSICYITLQSDDGKNSLDLHVAERLLNLLRKAEKSNCKVIVIYSKCRASFSKGYMFTTDKEKNTQEAVAMAEDYIDIMNELILALYYCSKVTIAAIHGAAYGAGLNFTLGCDFRFAVKNAKLVEGFIDAGLIPDVGSNYFLPRLCGLGNIYNYIMSGNIITGLEAKQLGIVNEVFDSKEEMYKKILSMAAIDLKRVNALKISKTLFDQSMRNSIETQLECEKKYLLKILNTLEENYD